MKRGFYHLHRRKRIYQKLEKYPHPNKGIRALDRLVLILAFIMPIVELPQLIKIFAEKTAEGVSLSTWSFFVLCGIPWLIYGIVHKEKPIVILYLLWIIIDSAIVIGILLY